MIVIVFGLPGTGKSYFSRALSKMLNIKHVNTDRIRKGIFPNPLYETEERFKVYDKMLELIKKMIVDGEEAVLDGTFMKETLRDHFRKEIQALRQKVFFIEMRAQEEVIKRRVSVKREFSEADFEVYLKLKHEFEPMKGEHLVLFSDKLSLDQMLQETLKYIKNELF